MVPIMVPVPGVTPGDSSEGVVIQPASKINNAEIISMGKIILTFIFI
jgi:hypothetical protein